MNNAELLGSLPDIFSKYTDQPWWPAYKAMFEPWQQNPGQGGQVTLPPMTTPAPTVPTTTQPNYNQSYAPFSGALPVVAAVNPWGTNNFQAYDNQGDMDARMALGGAGARYVPPQVPVTQPPVVTQPPTYRPPVTGPTGPGGPANPVPTYPRPTQPTSPYVPGPGIPGYVPPSGQPGWRQGPTGPVQYWPSIGRGYTPATNSSFTDIMRPTARKQPRTFTGWGV